MSSKRAPALPTLPPLPAFEYRAISSLKPNPRNARTHSKKQVREIARSIEAFGFNNPLLTDSDGMVLAGHGRLEAAKHLGWAQVPTLRLEHLSEAQRRAYVLADNKLAEKAGCDRELLAVELSELALVLPEVNLDLTVTGFDVGEIDLIIADRASEPPPSDEDGLDGDFPPLPDQPVTQRGDLWLLGPHRLLCGDARSLNDLDRLMQADRARVAFLDPPFNVRVNGHVGGRGKIKHAEFAFASGEMTKPAFTQFLTESLVQAARVSVDGAIHFVCMDWRHIEELSAAGAAVYDDQLNLCVWDKGRPGQGSLYRSEHELVLVYKVGTAVHRNGVELGRHGRNRSNIWRYKGAGAFKAGGLEELSWHPTVKPVAMVADALRDCSIKGEIVLDTFLGSGTTLMAAERIGRVCRAIEYEPKYCDVAIQRWQRFTKLEAICAASGMTYAERAESDPAANATSGLAAEAVN